MRTRNRVVARLGFTPDFFHHHPMNSKHIPAAFFVVGSIAGVAWWFWPEAPEQAPASVAEVASTPAEDLAPPPIEPPPAPMEVEAPPAPPAFDPQLELGTAVADFIRIAQSGDMITLMKNYMPPDQMAKASPEEIATMALTLQAMMQSPEGAPMVQTMIAESQSIQNTVPTYDATGNRATYAMPAGSLSRNVVFVRVDGRWYRE